MSKILSITCPKCSEAFEVDFPKPERKRGQLFGIALADMTDEQLKREIINSKSVLYKAKQRGADEKTVTANEARVNAAMAEKDSRQGTTEAVDIAAAGGSVYVEAAAQEI